MASGRTISIRPTAGNDVDETLDALRAAGRGTRTRPMPTPVAVPIAPRLGAIVALLTLGLVLAACGADDGDDRPDDAVPTSGPAALPEEGTYVALGSSNAAGPGAGALLEGPCLPR